VDLQWIKTTDADKLVMKFKNVTLDFSSRAAGDIVPMLLMTQFMRFSDGFPAELIPRLEVEPPSRVRKMVVDTGPGKGFLETYKAMCDFHRLPVSKTFYVYAEGLFNAGIREMKLQECPGIEMNEYYTFDLTPIAG
jgi:hypothetical protein